MAAGAVWLSSRRSPILLVPSVIVPEEAVALINPAHAASCQDCGAGRAAVRLRRAVAVEVRVAGEKQAGIESG